MTLPTHHLDHMPEHCGGKPDGLAPVELSDIAAGKGGFALNGINEQDYSGRSVSGAGDVNGDGLADLISGAVGADPNGEYSGQSYVVFGKADGTAVELADIAAGEGGGFALNGAAAGDFAGFSVSGAGDVNGDGLADLIVGAAFADPNGEYSGQSYVVFGKADGTAVELSDIAAGQGGGFALNGINAYDDSGFSVSGAGDVNGDGLADLIVGAPNNGMDFTGQSYVVFGKACGNPIELSDIAAGQGGGLALNGAAAYAFTGSSVSGAGDVNGDGLADLIVGAPGAGLGASGQSYVVFGKADESAVELSDIAAGQGGGFALNGAAAADLAGSSVSGAGDVNGDGLADLIVGAPSFFYFGPSADAGQSYVVFGKADGTAVELADIAAGQGGGFALNGAAVGDRAGFSVSGAGDVNGDGSADLIIGAPGADPNGADSSGQSYVVFGGDFLFG